jgi:hypothetical protein
MRCEPLPDRIDAATTKSPLVSGPTSYFSDLKRKSGAVRWFKYKPTPSVVVCDIDPQAIVAEHNGRHESELILDPAELEMSCIFLDDGREEPYEIHEFDDECYEQVASADIAGWRAGHDRSQAKKDELDRRRMRRARKRLLLPPA